MTGNAQNTVDEVRSIAVQPNIPFWQVPLEFAVHGIVGTSVFAIIAALAVALDRAIGWLETHQISRDIIFGLKAAEYALFLTDLILFGVFLWRAARRTIKGL